MPIYEYRCPNGHTFERFQSMSAPAPEKCDVCGAAPLELVLYPIAIHYKGSGFYSTDYGKKGAAAPKKDGGDVGLVRRATRRPAATRPRRRPTRSRRPTSRSRRAEQRLS